MWPIELAKPKFLGFTLKSFLFSKLGVGGVSLRICISKKLHITAFIGSFFSLAILEGGDNICAEINSFATKSFCSTLIIYRILQWMLL